MPSSIPLSVRVTADDAAFLAQYQADDAKTPSDKLRAILADARARHEGTRDFDGCVALITDLLRPALHGLRTAQRDIGVRSDLVFRLYERLPEIMAELITAAPRGDADLAALRRFEAAVADQLFGLIEETLDMGLTTRSRSYDPALVKSRLGPILEIVELVKLSHSQVQGEAK